MKFWIEYKSDHLHSINLEVLDQLERSEYSNLHASSNIVSISKPICKQQKAMVLEILLKDPVPANSPQLYNISL